MQSPADRLSAFSGEVLSLLPMPSTTASTETTTTLCKSIAPNVRRGRLRIAASPAQMAMSTKLSTTALATRILTISVATQSALQMTATAAPLTWATSIGMMASPSTLAVARQLAQLKQQPTQIRRAVSSTPSSSARMESRTANTAPCTANNG